VFTWGPFLPLQLGPARALILLLSDKTEEGKYVGCATKAIHAEKLLSELLATDRNLSGVDFTGFLPMYFCHLLRISGGTGVHVAKWHISSCFLLIKKLRRQSAYSKLKYFLEIPKCFVWALKSISEPVGKSDPSSNRYTKGTPRELYAQ